MKERDIRVCPSTLAEGHTTYSKLALRNLFDGKLVSSTGGFLFFGWAY